MGSAAFLQCLRSDCVVISCVVLLAWWTICFMLCVLCHLLSFGVHIRIAYNYEKWPFECINIQSVLINKAFHYSDSFKITWLLILILISIFVIHMCWLSFIQYHIWLPCLAFSRHIFSWSRLHSNIHRRFFYLFAFLTLSTLFASIWSPSNLLPRFRSLTNYIISHFVSVSHS